MTSKQADDHIFRAWFVSLLWLILYSFLSVLANGPHNPGITSPTLWWLPIPVIGALVYWASRNAAAGLLLLLPALVWANWYGLNARAWFQIVSVLVVGYFLLQGLRAVWLRRNTTSNSDGVPNQRL